MAVTTLVYYHKLCTSGSTSYYLYFVPGDTSNLTVDDWNGKVLMPHDFIKSCKIKRNFDNDMPIGQELGSVMELELNLKSSHFNSTYMSTFKAQILQQESTGEITAWTDKDSNNVNFHVPNRWFILKDTGVTSVIWDGYQERVKQFTIDNEGSYKINILDTVTTIMRNIPIEQIGFDLHNTYKATSANLADELIYYYTDYGGKRYHISNSSTDWNKNNLKYCYVSFIDDFITKVETYFNDLYAIYRRNYSVGTFEFATDPLTNWTFYKQNPDNQHDHTQCAEVTDKSELNIINSIYIEGADTTIVGGCLSDTKSEGSWGQELKNLNNLFKGLAETLFYKGVITYGMAGSAVNLTYNCFPVFEHEVGSTISIDSSNIFNDWSITYGTEYEQSIVHITNCNEEDLTEISKPNANLGIDEGSYEVKNILHNILCANRIDKYTDDQKSDWTDGTLRRLATIATVTQCLYYYDTDLDANRTADEARIAKITEYCTLDLGDLTVNSGTYPNQYDIYGLLGNLNDTAVPTYSNLVLPRQEVTGMAYVVANAANTVFNTRYQGFIEFSCKGSVIGIDDLGKPLDIDISTLTSLTKLSSNNPNAVITNIDWDTFKDECKVKAFIRGDK